MRLLPWVAVAAKLGRRYFWNDCTECKRTMDYEQRRRVLCGWIPERDWVEPERRQPQSCYVPGSPVVEPTICPGYAVQLPEAIEAARAWGWFDKGQLSLRHPEPSDELMDLIELFNSERVGAESYLNEEMIKQAKRERNGPR